MGLRPRSWLETAGWIGTVIALLTVVQYLRPPEQSLAWVTLFDAGHAPLFGVISLAVLRGLTASPLAQRNQRRFLYLLALGLSVVLAALSEWLQVAAHRNRDPWDVLHSAIGAGAFLLFAASRDPQSLVRSNAQSRIRALFCGAAGILLTLVFVPGVQVGYAYAQRASALPLLCDFKGTWERRFLATNHAQLEFIPAPSVNNEKTAPAWRIHFEPAPFSAFKLLEPYPDWTDYRRLRLVLRSQMADPIVLVLRVHDRPHDNRAADRFKRDLAILPGTNEFSISLADIRQAPEGREMNMAAIARLNLFVMDARTQLKLDLLELRLQ
ncbi:MAG: hypothetical protein IH885_07135 [Myxococcales bacterium]|nr:hypothetical protein [Myxococcales bacterium]